MNPFIDASSMVSSPDKLRLLFNDIGYLFIRGLVSKEVILSLFTKVLEVTRTAGWLSKAMPPEYRLADPRKACREPEPQYRAVHNQIWRLEEFHRVFHNPRLISICRDILQGEVLVHPRKVLRITFPESPEDSKFSNPPHQDYPEVQGSLSTITVWIPLHDCSSDSGGLTIASGSQMSGVLPVTYSSDWFGLQVRDPPTENWHSGDMRIGDALLFHSLTVHKGLPNISGKLRMSVDCRYQPATDPIGKNCLEPGHQLSWPSVYADWSSRDLQYYWTHYTLSVEPFSHRFEDERDRLLLDAGNNADLQALPGLRRIVEYNRHPNVRREARRLVRALQFDLQKSKVL